jgi:hypothetical protein
MRTFATLVALALFCQPTLLPCAAASPDEAAAELIQRVLPVGAEAFVTETIPTADGKDVFEMEASRGKIVLRGNNGVSIAMALSWYLRHEFLLGPWIRDARAWGTTPAEADYYEANARRIITEWGAGLRDYAHREWNGLVRDYYYPRWWRWAKKCAPDAVNGQSDPGPQGDFVKLTNSNYSLQPVGDPVEVAKRLFGKYRSQMGKEEMP